MKIRQSFVSNSSSSSFIIISTSEELVKPDVGEKLYINKNIGFGWEYEKYNDYIDKIVFCYYQAKYVLNKKWLAMLEKVIKKHLSVSEIVWKISINYNDKNYGYIDHQSCSTEKTNIEMFESEEKLKLFLFNPSSYIQTDNDNH